MPSDPLPQALQAAVTTGLDAFRSVVASTSEQVRSALDAYQQDGGSTAALEEAQLGEFGGNCLDVDRFATLIGDKAAPPAEAQDALEAAHRCLQEVHAKLAEWCTVEFKEGDLHAAVATALTRLGRAFGAARVVDLARRGAFLREKHAAWLQGLPFERWNARERSLAPPMVVRCTAHDLLASGLAPFLDGGVRLLLMVEGPAPAAPLASLVRPGVLVVQSDQAEELEAVLACNGPAIGAFLAGDYATFIHHPSGSTWPERLVVSRWPESTRSRAHGGLSAKQQERDLELLRALATADATVPPTEPTSLNGTPTSGPVDKLAAFLLSRAHIED